MTQLYFSSNQAKTAPYLYRLVFALLILYYIDLGRPTICLVLILCCLPLFIQMVLPYAGERTLRRVRAATEDQISNLPLEPFDPENFNSEDSRLCVICLSEYAEGDMLRCLPCKVSLTIRFQRIRLVFVLRNV